MTFAPRKGAVRTFTCRACGDVYHEEWTGNSRHDFQVSGPHADAVPACSQHETHPGRGPHAFAVEVVQ